MIVAVARAEACSEDAIYNSRERPAAKRAMNSPFRPAAHFRLAANSGPHLNIRFIARRCLAVC
jgi:hypothetical protein